MSCPDICEGPAYFCTDKPEIGYASTLLTVVLLKPRLMENALDAFVIIMWILVANLFLSARKLCGIAIMDWLRTFPVKEASVRMKFAVTLSPERNLRTRITKERRTRERNGERIIL
ncbi:MAG: hypothetical protein ABJM70_00005 [Ekhidna sp.]